MSKTLAQMSYEAFIPRLKAVGWSVNQAHLSFDNPWLFPHHQMIALNYLVENGHLDVIQDIILEHQLHF